MDILFGDLNFSSFRRAGVQWSIFMAISVLCPWFSTWFSVVKRDVTSFV